MSDYITIAGVDAWLPTGASVDNQQTEPTRDQVTTVIIPGVEAQINAFVQLTGVTPPETDTVRKAKYTILGEREVAYQIMAIRGAKTEDKAPPLYVGWHEEFMAVFSPETQSGGDTPAITPVIIASSGTFDDVSAFPKCQTRNW